MSSHTRRTAWVDGVPTAYWQYGNDCGPPVILVHGFRGDHHGLEGIARFLADYRVLVPDLPGFGASARLNRQHVLRAFGSWLHGFAGQVAKEPIALLGHSFGSLVVSQAVHDGLTPATLVLVNPISAPALEGPRARLTRLAVRYYRAGAVLPAPIANRILRSPTIVRVMSEAMAKTRDRELRAWIHDQHARYFSTFTDRDSLLEAFTASVNHTVQEYADSFTMPTQIIAGEEDDITPLTEQVRLSRHVPESELRVIRRAGHLVHYEAPAEVARHVRDFISRRSQR